MILQYCYVAPRTWSHWYIISYMRALSFLLLFSCSSVKILDRPKPNMPYVDSAFTRFALKFEAEAQSRGVNLEMNKLNIFMMQIGVGNNEYVVAGLCSKFDEPYTIIVDTTFWITASLYQQEETLYHEFGHCLLKRSHCNKKVNGKSVSIMRSRAPIDSDYPDRRKEYLDELFNESPHCR